MFSLVLGRQRPGSDAIRTRGRRPWAMVGSELSRSREGGGEGKLFPDKSSWAVGLGPREMVLLLSLEGFWPTQDKCLSILV